MTELQRVQLFANLPEAALQRLMRAATALEPRTGAEIFVQGAAADAVYAIVGGEGCVRIGSANRHGKQLMVEIFHAGDVFGEIGVLDGGVRTATVSVDGRVRLLRIGAAGFMAVLQDTPALGANLALALSRRLRRTFALFEDATFESLEVRLARQLIYLAGRKAGPEVVLTARLRQQALADLLGATTRSIITILNDWRDRHLIHYDAAAARLTICNMARMRSLIDA